ncbi:SRPBCC family protein [Nocardia higoensis]|uniref:SRPBCC family protein n=1 Tax=Nocardia higoensis TaxID=228599 RepID=A0ABS0D7Y9_9NOCA|nr:SRPBCC family protein [Nocardia higoensis]MBF6352949.1 SRPBCC family protein [Nocardia higoensis]
MAERSVAIRAQVGDVDPDVAFARLRDFPSYAEHVDVVRGISLGVDAQGNQVSSWSVWFRSGLLEWTERDVVDEASRILSFEQVTGDLARFDGAWRVALSDAGVTVSFDAVVDLGIPSLADMLDPLAERALRTNTVDILRGLFGPDIEFGGVAV